MITGEALRMAVQALWAHKGRSVLTIMGVVIGVASVLAVTSLGAALEASLVDSLNSEEDRSIYVIANTGDPGQQGGPSAGQYGLIFTEVDREALLAIDGVEAVIAGGSVAITGLQWSDKEQVPWRTISATFAVDQAIADDDLYADGGVFEDGEDEVVIGSTVAKQLGEPEAGDDLTFILPDGGERVVTIAGILEEQAVGFISLTGDVNNGVFVPVDPFYTVMTKSPSTGGSVRVYDGLTVVAETVTQVTAVKADVQEYMDDESDASQLLQEDVEILVADAGDIQESITDALDQVTIFIAAIAAVSLLVGGIMIGTIMLITVTERTKEIGMMKAIGAYNSEILRMFLMESAIIGFLGSIVGILLGLGAGSILVASLFAGEDGDITFAVPWEWVGYAVLVGVLTGIIAGYFPARRATKIQPVEALSYE